MRWLLPFVLLGLCPPLAGCPNEEKRPSSRSDDDDGDRAKKRAANRNKEPKPPPREAFEKRLGGGKGLIRPTVTAMAPDGDLIVTGQLRGDVVLDGMAPGSRGGFVARFGPDGAHRWTRVLGSERAVDVDDLAVDAEGHVYAVGSTDGAIDLGRQSLAEHVGTQHGFIVAYDAKGDVRWAKAFAGRVRAAALDADDGIALTGDFTGTVDFGGDKMTGPTAIARSAAWIGSFGRDDGRHRWSKKITEDLAVGDLEIDSAGDIVLLGTFKGTIDCGGEPVKSRGGYDLVVAKFDSKGGHRWSKSFGGPAWEVSEAMAVDAKGNIYLTAGFEKGLDLGQGPLPHRKGYDIFAVKLDPSGKLLWNRAWGSNGHDTPNDIAVDAEGHVAITGTYEAELQLGGESLPLQGRRSGFVLKLDREGKHLFSHHFGGPKDDMGEAVLVEPGGSVVVAGFVDAHLRQDIVVYTSGDLLFVRYVD